MPYHWLFARHQESKAPRLNQENTLSLPYKAVVRVMQGGYEVWHHVGKGGRAIDGAVPTLQNLRDPRSIKLRVMCWGCLDTFFYILWYSRKEQDLLKLFPHLPQVVFSFPASGFFICFHNIISPYSSFPLLNQVIIHLTLHTLPSLPRASRRGSFIPFKHGKRIFKMLVLTATSWNQLNNLNQILCSEDKRTSKEDNGLSTVMSHLEVI